MGTLDTIGGTPRNNPTLDYFPICNICKKDCGECECTQLALDISELMYRYGALIDQGLYSRFEKELIEILHKATEQI